MHIITHDNEQITTKWEINVRASMLTSIGGGLFICISISEQVVVLTEDWVEMARAEWRDVRSGKV